jgi:uncharacterized protein YeaC (DUF1315 family)
MENRIEELEQQVKVEQTRRLMSDNLNNLTYSAMVALAECTDTETGEIDMGKWSQSALPMEEKRESCLAVIKSLSNKEENLTQEITRLIQLRETARNNIQNLKRNVLDSMEMTGCRRLSYKDGIHTAWMTSRSKTEYDSLALPDEFREQVTSERIKKAELKQALEEGREIPGAFLYTSNSLTVRRNPRGEREES